MTTMRDLTPLERYRMRNPEVFKLWGWYGDETCGAFSMPSPVDGGELHIIASGAEGTPWEHLSVSRKNRCPNWTEMEHVKHAFAGETETWVQFHVPASDHINLHPHTLHMWRLVDGEFPRPPSILV